MDLSHHLLQLLLLLSVGPSRPSDYSTYTQEGRVEKSCEAPQPLHLREPHQHIAYLALDSRHHYLFKTTFPRIDNQWYYTKWRSAIRQQQQNNAGPERNEPGTEPATESAGRSVSSTWNMEPRFDWKKVTAAVINEAFMDGKQMFSQLQTCNLKLAESGSSLKGKDWASVVHHKLFHKALASEPRAGHMAGTATLTIKTIFKMQHATDLALLGPQDLCVEFIEPQEPPVCSETLQKYRTADGTCNNHEHPTWGAAHTAFRRLLPPNYGDGVMSLTEDSKGRPMPSARLVSYKFNQHHNTQSDCFTLLHMTFGQFLDHDLTSTPMSTNNGTTIPCCQHKTDEPLVCLHPQCAPIPIPPEDPLYSAYGRNCMEFVRSVPAESCVLGPREQTNTITGYIDCSAVYGSSDEQTRELRALEDGLLAMQATREGQELLPANTDPEDECNDGAHFDRNQFCFTSGDHRANEQILLSLLTTIFARQHNLLARALKKINPTWNDEKLYQEARRIVIAQLQRIVYYEFLPGVLGPPFMRALGINTQKDGKHSTDYDPKINAAISNEFATAAYRFGHSMIPKEFLDVDINGTAKSINLNNLLFDPVLMYSSKTLGNMARGALIHRVGVVDASFSPTIRGELFQKKQKPGLDLPALNIQRGRDHGLGSYVSAREACSLGKTRTFVDLIGHMDTQSLENLQKIYDDVADIDLFVGGLAEHPIEGAQVGPVFACIIADQFTRLKKGDRYWFENKDQAGSFTQDQLRQIHKTSMGRILCDTVLEMTVVQRWPFNMESALNPLLRCDLTCFPKLNLTYWQE